jgi:hypothetical protein
LMNRASIARSGIELPYLESVCKRIAAAFGISRGVCMVDLMLTADGLQVLESSIRPGLSTFVPLMQQVYGYTSLGLLVRLVQGENVAVTLPDDEGLVVHILARGCGRIVRFDMSRVETGPGVIDMHRYAEAGDVVEDSRLDHWDSLLGYVLVKNPPPGRIPEVLEEIDDAVDLSMAEAGLGCRAPAG